MTFLIILLIIFLHYTKILFPIEKIITIILSPFQTTLYSATQSSSEKISNVTSKKDWILENQELKQKINQLGQEIVQLKMFIEENSMIERQNEYLKSMGFKFINSKVIAASYDSNPNLLIINKGSGSGIKENMPVVINEGLVVGKIIKTENSKSFLLLLIDNQCKLTASKLGNSEIIGLALGKHNTSINLINILKNADINKGDLIITSGQDKNIPAGLLIGEVQEIFEEEEDLFKSANIMSNVNFGNLRVVSVVIEN